MSLSGTEILFVNTVQANGQPAATTEQTTTGAIAALASIESAPFVATAITTVGNGTLTAAGLVGGEIVRTGPTAAFTDTTDTAANIVAAGPLAGSSFSILIKNSTAFPQTISAGTGVTLPLTVLIPAFSVGNYIANVTSGTAITLLHIDTTPISIGANVTAPNNTAVSTVGAGTLTAASFIYGYITRTGAQSATAFTDTIDTAANIIAALPNLVNKIGTSTIITYANTTNAPATITGGTGVTVSGVTVVQANSVASYILTYTAAATLTMVGVGSFAIPTLGTFTANGATTVTVSNTAFSPNSQVDITLKTVGGTVGATLPRLLTATPGTGFTVSGTASDTSVYNYAITG